MGALDSFDRKGFEFLNHAGQNQLLDLLMVTVTILGASYVMLMLALALWFRSRRELAFDVIVAVLVATVIAEAVKFVVDRERPYLVLTDAHTISFYGLATASGPSFPSGHATRAFALAVVLMRRSGTARALAAFAAASLIAVSRVFLGLHWPTDVIAGALVGVSLGLILSWLGATRGAYSRFREGLIARLRCCHPSDARSRESGNASH